MSLKVKREREKTASVQTKLLTAYNNQGIGSLTMSYRGAISGFDLGMMRLPLVFSFKSENEGVQVGKRYLISFGSKFEVIDEADLVVITKDKACGDYGLIAVEETNGQLGPNDYKCFCILEQILYKQINDNYLQYSTGVHMGTSQEVLIGTTNQFATSAFNDNSSKAYKNVKGFLKRIKGLGFTPLASSGFSFAYKTKRGSEPEEVEDYLKPFPGSRYVGEETGNQVLYLRVDNRIILNILNGGTKLQYNEIINSISNPKSKHLFRMLSLFDKKGDVFINYSEFIDTFELERQKCLCDVKKQIGRIAKPVNYDMDNPILLWDESGSEDMPFDTRPLDDKHNWQIIFFLNSGTTPNNISYGSKSEAHKVATKITKENRKLLLELREKAAEHGLKPEEYLMAYGDIELVRIRGMAVEEVAQIIRHFELKADKHRKLGERLEKACGGITNAQQIIKQQEIVLAEQQSIERELREAENRKNAKGRPQGSLNKSTIKRMQPKYVSYDPEIPF